MLFSDSNPLGYLTHFVVKDRTQTTHDHEWNDKLKADHEHCHRCVKVKLQETFFVVVYEVGTSYSWPGERDTEIEYQTQ